MIGCLWPSLSIDLQLLTDPPKARLPALDHSQYITGLPSGYGSRECAAFLSQMRTCPNGALVVIPDHYVHRAVSFYLQPERTAAPQVAARLISPESRQSWDRLLASAGDRCLFLVLTGGRVPRHRRPSQAQVDAVDIAGTLVAEFPKPGGRLKIQLYRIEPDRFTETDPSTGQ